MILLVFQIEILHFFAERSNIAQKFFLISWYLCNYCGTQIRTQNRPKLFNSAVNVGKSQVTLYLSFVVISLFIPTPPNQKGVILVGGLKIYTNIHMKRR